MSDSVSDSVSDSLSDSASDSVTGSVTGSVMFNRYQTKAKVVLGQPVRAHQGRRSAQPARRGQAKLDRRTLWTAY